MDVKAFPSGVAFDSVDIYADILMVALPVTGRLKLKDIEYLCTIADAMHLAGVSLSEGEFSTFVPITAYHAYRAGNLGWRQFVTRFR